MAQKVYEVGRVTLGWVIANLLGAAAVGALGFFFPFVKAIPGMLVSSLLISLPIDLAQWIAFRRVDPISILWVLTTSAGVLLGLVAGPLLPLQKEWASPCNRALPH